MTTTMTPRFEGDVDGDKNSITTLKEMMLNHLLIYNRYLELVCSKPDLIGNTDDETWTHVKTVLSEFGSDVVYCEPALRAELRYLCNKFRKGMKAEKLLSNIQYLTFCRKRANGYIKLSSDGRVTIKHNKGVIDGLVVNKLCSKTSYTFINISYSLNESRIVLKIF